jgi:hypothetical protein
VTPITGKCRRRDPPRAPGYGGFKLGLLRGIHGRSTPMATRENRSRTTARYNSPLPVTSGLGFFLAHAVELVDHSVEDHHLQAFMLLVG